MTLRYASLHAACTVFPVTDLFLSFQCLLDVSFLLQVQQNRIAFHLIILPFSLSSSVNGDFSVLPVIQVCKLDNFNSSTIFSQLLSCMFLYFVSSLPTKSALHHVSLLLQCKSLSAITSSLFAKVILLLLQYSFSPWIKFQPLILGFSSSAEYPHLNLLFHISLYYFCAWN